MAPVPPENLPGGRPRIRDVSELLGIPAPTLRSWERRYGVPTSSRTLGGHRRYAPDELQQLRLMRDEIARGMRASDAARSVRLLLDRANPAHGRITGLLEASERADPAGLRSVLDEAHEQLGLAATIDDVVMPAMRQVGAWWESGRCGIAQEHVTTETVRGWLARLTTLAGVHADEPPVLLACGPSDQHTVGLEALAALLAQQHQGSRLMGPRTSEQALVTATIAHDAAAVVVVSHLRAQRRPAVEALAAAARTGTEAFYAGNAFSSPTQRVGVHGTYLGTSVSAAATTIMERLESGRRGPGRPRAAA
ncbi:MAG: MerR family transcriptional regulator [Aeromicrobium sp.]